MYKPDGDKDCNFVIDDDEMVDENMVDDCGDTDGKIVDNGIIDVLEAFVDVKPIICML